MPGAKRPRDEEDQIPNEVWSRALAFAVKSALQEKGKGGHPKTSQPKNDANADNNEAEAEPKPSTSGEPSPKRHRTESDNKN